MSQIFANMRNNCKKGEFLTQKNFIYTFDKNGTRMKTNGKLAIIKLEAISFVENPRPSKKIKINMETMNSIEYQKCCKEEIQIYF